LKAIAGISTTRPVKFFNAEDAEVRRGKTVMENEIGETVSGDEGASGRRAVHLVLENVLTQRTQRYAEEKA